MYKSVKNENCPCRRNECERHSNCEACVANHRERGYPPSCQRTEGAVYRNEANISERGYIYGKWMGKDDTWTISYGNVYCYLLVGTEKALLIDTAYGEGDLRRFVEEITDKPVIVANTHGHFDHTGGNPWWKEAYMSAEAAKDAKRAFSPEMQTRLESMPYPDYKINIIDENTTFDLGGRTVQVVPIPAHHGGSVAFIDSASRYLFTGDELEAGQVLMFLTETNQIQAHKENMEKLLSLSHLYDAICPAHNGTPINKKYVSDFLELDKQILAGTQEEMPNTAGFGFPPQPASEGPFSGDIRRAQYGGASVLYKPF
ncbi:MAG: MBL fold metallo-hydrolase [Defluviitaleaceae bacterium]|nr:MBL fold metallo-hydrolase [Defluviitaleaceae bacterium]MCL2273738.1 MBL fold metallo-hydrolase [Defluviitaleaceae bacterium]